MKANKNGLIFNNIDSSFLRYSKKLRRMKNLEGLIQSW